MVYVAQFEREMMKERQVEGIKRAQAEGKYKGRVPKAMRQADKVKALVAAGVDKLKIQEQLGMSKASYYRCLKALACLYGASPLNQTWDLRNYRGSIWVRPFAPLQSKINLYLSTNFSLAHRT